MARETVVIRVHLRWWLKWYVYAVTLGCYLTGMRPDEERVGYWMRRGMWVETRRLRMEVAA